MKQSFILKTSVGEYSANIDKEILIELLKAKSEGKVVDIPLGKGTSYLEGEEYNDDAIITLFPESTVFAIVEHNLSEKEKVNLNTK